MYTRYHVLLICLICIQTLRNINNIGIIVRLSTPLSRLSIYILADDFPILEERDLSYIALDKRRQSGLVNITRYHVYIVEKHNSEGKYAIKEYYCMYKNDARTVGCCVLILCLEYTKYLSNFIWIPSKAY